MFLKKYRLRTLSKQPLPTKVEALYEQGKKKGTYIGKVAVRANGYFNITREKETIEGIKYCYCQVIHRCDGYSYS